jgi:hypothetical protein
MDINEYNLNEQEEYKPLLGVEESPLIQEKIFDNVNTPDDSELAALLKEMEQAEANEANIQKQIDAMMAGIFVCLDGLNEGLREQGHDGIVKIRDGFEGMHNVEKLAKMTLGLYKAETSAFIFAYDNSRKSSELLELYNVNDETLDDLKSELIEMAQKVTVLREALKGAKVNTIKTRSKVAIRKSMLGIM